MEQVYIPQTKSSLLNPSILIVDNHSTRYDIATVALCMANGVDLMMLPPNCMHFAQPLDRTCFGPLKDAASKLDWSSAVHQRALTRNNLIALMQPCLASAFTVHNIIQGFLLTGILTLSSAHLPDTYFSKVIADDKTGLLQRLPGMEASKVPDLYGALMLAEPLMAALLQPPTLPQAKEKKAAAGGAVAVAAAAAAAAGAPSDGKVAAVGVAVPAAAGRGKRAPKKKEREAEESDEATSGRVDHQRRVPG